jgi:WD40 repeat protein
MNYNISSDPCCLEWNHDGELIGVMSADNMMHIYDPRIFRKSIVTSTGHDGSKQQKMKWLGNTGQILTVGSMNYSRGRQYSVFDMRFLAKGPLCTKKLDN